MSLLESICALWVFALVAGASFAVWDMSVKVMQISEERTMANACANAAAERWASGGAQDGQTSFTPNCMVTETEESDHTMVEIVADCAGQKVSLWIPE